MITKFKNLIKMAKRACVSNEKSYYYYASLVVEHMKGVIFNHFKVPIHDVDIILDIENNGTKLAAYRFNLVVQSIRNEFIKSYEICNQVDERLSEYAKSKFPELKDRVITEVSIQNKQIIVFLKSIYTMDTIMGLHQYINKVIESLTHEVYHIRQQLDDVTSFKDYKHYNEYGFDEYRNQIVELTADLESKKFVFENEKLIKNTLFKVKIKDDLALGAVVSLITVMYWIFMSNILNILAN